MTDTSATETETHPSAEAERVVREFTELYHDLRDQTLGRTRWFGISIVKTPMDLVALQEIVAETRPELIVETGVFAGGSALFMASLLGPLGIDGKVIAVDVDLSAVPPHIAKNPRIELWEGGSTDPEIVARLTREAEGRRVMVDLDADHRAEHVSEELRLLAPLVTPGCYLVVEDTWLGGRPVRPDEAPGPAGALEEWLARGQPFEVDRWRERLLLTGNPGGYLRRVDEAGGTPGGPPRLDDFVVPSGRVSSDGSGAPARSTGDDDQSRRYAHEAEFDRLRAVNRELKDELRERERELRDRERTIDELRAGGGSSGRALGAARQTVRSGARRVLEKRRGRARDDDAQR